MAPYLDDELTYLITRAETLRARFSDLLDDLGEFAPPLRKLHDDLGEIDRDLAALGYKKMLT